VTDGIDLGSEASQRKLDSDFEITSSSSSPATSRKACCSSLQIIRRDRAVRDLDKGVGPFKSMTGDYFRGRVASSSETYNSGTCSSSKAVAASGTIINMSGKSCVDQ